MITDEERVFAQRCYYLDTDDLRKELVTFPTQYAYWAFKFADAKREHRLTKVEVESLVAVLREEIREDLEASGGKVTEKRIDYAVASHPEYLAAVKEEVNAEHSARWVKGLLMSLDKKGDSLVSLGASERQEIESFGSRAG